MNYRTVQEICRSLFIFSTFVNINSQKNLLCLLLSGLLCSGFQHHGRSLFTMPAWHHWAQTYVAREAEDFFWIFSSPPAAYWMWSSQEEEQNKTWYILELVSTSWLMFCLLDHMKTLFGSSLSATFWSLSKIAVWQCWLLLMDFYAWRPHIQTISNRLISVKPTKATWICSSETYFGKLDNKACLHASFKFWTL